MTEAAEADPPAQDDAETCETCGSALRDDSDAETCGTCRDVQPTAALRDRPPF